MDTTKGTDVQRSTIRVGDLVHSSHGYDLLISEVTRLGNAGQTTKLVGHLHGDPEAPTRSEHYPSESRITLIQRGTEDARSRVLAYLDELDRIAARRVAVGRSDLQDDAVHSINGFDLRRSDLREILGS